MRPMVVVGRQKFGEIISQLGVRDKFECLIIFVCLNNYPVLVFYTCERYLTVENEGRGK